MSSYVAKLKRNDGFIRDCMVNLPEDYKFKVGLPDHTMDKEVRKRINIEDPYSYTVIELRAL